MMISPGITAPGLLTIYWHKNAVPSPDGYVTILNCPKCGCTPGKNDVITLDQLEGRHEH